MENEKMSKEEVVREIDTLATEFLIEGIKDKVIEGITYLFVFNTDKETLKKYDDMIELAKKLNIQPEQFISKIKVQNGCIYDMNTQRARALTLKLVKQVNRETGGETPVKDVVSNHPEERRKKEIADMAKYIIKENKAGKKKIPLAIYSRNREDRIKFIAKNSESKDVTVEYKAFNVRNNDLKEVAQVCAAQGVRITNVTLNEILPTKTGVRGTIIIG